MRGIAALLVSAAWVAWVVSVVCVGAVRNGTGSRYGFYRGMGQQGLWGAEGAEGSARSTRRVFGGAAAQLASFPAACALLDRYWAARCSAAVLAPRWALTAAHCVSPRVAYIKYNARRPTAPEGDIAAVHYLYRHPSYKVVQEDEGRGMDVTLLHHDVGLVRTRVDMTLAVRPTTDPLVGMRLYNPVDLKNEQVEVLGFGRTERSTLGEELFSVKLQLVFCDRGSWFHCLCGVAGGRDSRGVCSGDSGGPVLYNGVQVGVTSMGPLECAQLGGRGGPEEAAPASGAASVFTALYNYADLVNSTIHDTDASLRMQRINSGQQRMHMRLASAALGPLLLTLVPAR